MSAERVGYQTEPLRAEIEGLELLVSELELVVREKDAAIAALRAELRDVKPLAAPR
jgi:hypothetical protein